VFRRRIAGTAVAIAFVFAVGTVGFHLILDESWHAAFYRTVITATLTGLDSQPRGVGAEFLTIGMALTGVAIFGYLATQAVEAIAHEVTGHARREKRQRRMIDQLEDHFIICGYGRVGRRAAEEIAASGQPFVVLDVTAEALAAAREQGVLYHEGKGTEDEDLAGAGIDRARGLIASADSDAENVYITLSARARRPDLIIVARASDAEAERKLRLAGADRVVRPYSTAGIEMAKLALKPQVAAFLEIVTSHGGPDLRFEEIEIRSEQPNAGMTIRELRIRSTTGAVIVALRKHDGSFDTTPDPDVVLDVATC
jgi:voltage-gated potassium channel